MSQHQIAKQNLLTIVLEELDEHPIPGVEPLVVVQSIQSSWAEEVQSVEKAKPAVRRIADAAELKIRAKLIEALRRMGSAVDVKAAGKALEQGSVDGILASVDWAAAADDLKPALALAIGAYNDAGVQTAKDTSSKVGQTYSFDLTNPLAIEWAATQSASMVTGVTEESRAALQGIITRVMAGGLPRGEAVKLIKQVVGLNSRQADSVESYRQELLEQDLTHDVIDRKLERYAAGLHRDRAVMIARQETMHAARAGQGDAWAQAVAHGLLKKTQQRKWSVTDDDRLCDICEPMDGQTVGLDEPFTTGDGDEVDEEGAHVGCRCAINLADDEGE